MSQLTKKFYLFEFQGNVADGVNAFIKRFNYTPKVVIKFEREYHGPKYYIQTNNPVLEV